MYHTYGKQAKITPKHTRNVLFNSATQHQICSIIFFIPLPIETTQDNVIARTTL